VTDLPNRAAGRFFLPGPQTAWQSAQPRLPGVLKWKRQGTGGVEVLAAWYNAASGRAGPALELEVIGLAQRRVPQ